MTKVAINGFGRIGRLVARVILEGFFDGDDMVELVHINDLNCDISIAAYLLEWDSVHGPFRGYDISNNDKVIQVERKGKKAEMTFSKFGDISSVKWDVDLVIDCTGVFKTTEKLEPYFKAGVKRVLVSAPVKGEGALNVVVSCNEVEVVPGIKVVTAASCTTNCIAPIIKVLNEQFGIKHGNICTVHNATLTQPILDAPNTKKSDPRRARSGMLNLAPTSTGSAKAIIKIFPELKGKLDGIAIRVPMLNSSITDLTIELEKDVTIEQVNAALKAFSDKVPEVLGFETRQLVSSDFVNDARSSIVDASSTMVTDGKMVKILAWYDNEYGYSNRVVDLAKIMCAQLSKQ